MGFESYGLGSPREDIEDDIPAGWYGLKCIGHYLVALQEDQRVKAACQTVKA